MNKPLFFLVFAVLLSSCSSKKAPKDLSQLEGYWEIEKAVFAEGQEKMYGVNTTIEYFFLEKSKGYRKKVQPQLDGQYLTSDDAQNFLSSTLEDGRVILEYSNGDVQWQEELTYLDQNRLELVSEQKIKYVYKRYEPLDL